MNNELLKLEGSSKTELQPRVRKYKSDLDLFKKQLDLLIEKSFSSATNVNDAISR